MRRKGRATLVVGATGRLGVAIAKALASAGSHVVLTARDPNKLDRLAEDIQKSCNVPLPPTVCADLLKDDAAASIVQTVSQKQIRIDDLVLACGPFPRTPFETLSRDELQRTLTVHAIQPLLLAQALAGDLSRAQGAVVALGDAGVMRPYTNHVAYITAKGALLAGLRALAVELAPDVRVNVVALGIVADPEADEDPLRTHRLATRSPLNRFGTPEEVVHAVMALLDATWATGEVWGIGR